MLELTNLTKIWKSRCTSFGREFLCISTIRWVQPLSVMNDRWIRNGFNKISSTDLLWSLRKEAGHTGLLWRRGLRWSDRHAAFEQAEKLFEFGCGTGRFASRLLAKHLSPSASYLGIDLSQTMIAIAQKRILPYKKRAKVSQSDGSMHFPLPDHSVDCVLSTYCLTSCRRKISSRRYPRLIGCSYQAASCAWWALHRVWRLYRGSLLHCGQRYFAYVHHWWGAVAQFSSVHFLSRIAGQMNTIT